jgi:hypothetical protein
MAKAPFKILIRKSEEMLGALCAEWQKRGLSAKAIARKAKPYTNAIRRASEELDRPETPGRN